MSVDEPGSLVRGLGPDFGDPSMGPLEELDQIAERELVDLAGATSEVPDEDEYGPATDPDEAVPGS